MSPTTPSRAHHIADPLVAETARRIAVVINDFKRELDKRDGSWAHAQGALELALESQTFVLTVVPDEQGDEYPISVRPSLKPNAPVSSANNHAARVPARRKSDAELDADFVPRKKRNLDEHDGASHKRPRTADPDHDHDHDHDMMPLITKEHLHHLLSQLRDDIQEDTSECVNHVQRLLRRFKDEWHESRQPSHGQPRLSHSRLPLRDSNHTLIQPGASFPSLHHDDQTTPIPDLVKREAKLLSTQIEWVENCRRMAADVHDKREETWRTSSAGFHDQQRQNREAFQNKMLHATSVHSQTLNQIWNEVKAIGLYAQNMKWETPASHLTYPPPSTQVPPPALPPATLPHTAPSPNSGAGRGRGGAGGGGGGGRGRGRGTAPSQ